MSRAIWSGSFKTTNFSLTNSKDLSINNSTMISAMVQLLNSNSTFILDSLDFKNSEC
jgi:hypothetical protein